MLEQMKCTGAKQECLLLVRGSAFNAFCRVEWYALECAFFLVNASGHPYRWSWGSSSSCCACPASSSSSSSAPSARRPPPRRVASRQPWDWPPFRLDLLVQLGSPCGLNPARRNSKQEILNGRQHHKRRWARSCHNRCGLDNRAVAEMPVEIVRLDTRLAGHKGGLLHGSRNGNDLQILAATRLRIDTLGNDLQILACTLLRIATLLAGHAPVFFLLLTISPLRRVEIVQLLSKSHQ